MTTAALFFPVHISYICHKAKDHKQTKNWMPLQPDFYSVVLEHEPRAKLKFISPSLSWLLPPIICENRSHSLWSKCLSSCGDCSRNWSNAINSPKSCQTKDKAETFYFLTEWHYSGTGSKSWNLFKEKRKSTYSG